MLPGTGPKPKALQFKHNMEALGAVLTFICRSSPYAEFRAAKLIAAVRLQLSTGCHVCLMQERQIVAYAGWLTISEEDAEAWLRGEVKLRPVPPHSTSAAALTIVSVVDRKHVPLLIRACRMLSPQQTIYFKRDYAEGLARKAKVHSFKPKGGAAKKVDVTASD